MKKPDTAASPVVAVPTLVRKLPQVIKMTIGDQSIEGRVLVGLDILPMEKTRDEAA